MHNRRKTFRRSARILVPVLLALSPVAALAQDETDGELGREVFTSEAQPACAVCHTLADAEATGTIGPNLDALQPAAQRVEAAVRSGVGVMPSYEDQLSDEQITAVAEYVATAAARD